MALQLEVILAENQRTGAKGSVIEINHVLSEIDLQGRYRPGFEYILVRTEAGVEEWSESDGIILY